MAPSDPDVDAEDLARSGFSSWDEYDQAVLFYQDLSQVVANLATRRAVRHDAVAAALFALGRVWAENPSLDPRNADDAAPPRRYPAKAGGTG